MSVAIPVLLNQLGINLGLSKVFSWGSSDLKKTIDILEKQLEHTTVECKQRLDVLTDDNKKIKADYDTTKTSLLKLQSDLISYTNKRDEAVKSIHDMKTIYLTEVERETETMILNAVQNFEDWFNKKIITDSSKDMSVRCRECKLASFRSAKENIGVALKDEFRIAFEKNGFLEAEGAEFDNYVKNLNATFRNIIRSGILQYYVHPNDIDNYFSLNPVDIEFERMVESVYTVIHGLISTVKSKETKLLKKIEAIRLDYETDVKGMSLNYIPLGKI